MQKFQIYKAVAERKQICMLGADVAAYNQAFTVSNLELAIGTPKRSAPSPGSIHCEMLQKPSAKSHEVLLTFYDPLWNALVLS